MKEIDMPFEFPKRLWKRTIEVRDRKPRLRVAASSFEKTPSSSTSDDQTYLRQDEVGSQSSSQNSRMPPQSGFETEPQVRVHTEAGNAKVTIKLEDIEKENLALNCAEDSLILSVRTSTGVWKKEIAFPFHVDPDTAKAVFRNGRLKLVVRKYGRFNSPGPRPDWV